MSGNFQAAHEYFKRVFNGSDPLKKKYSIKDFPDINKLIVKQVKRVRVKK